MPLLIWLAILDLLGWLHFPLCFRVGRMLRDRGLALSKLAGIFLPTYLAWLLGHTSVPHTRAVVGVVVLALVAVNAALLARDQASYASFFRRRWMVVVVLEAAFWLGGIGAGGIRSHIPAIAYDPNWYGAEKWSDFTLVSSLARQIHFPPLDPWLAGFPINYYYFGHLAWATMAKLTAIPPNIAYNLAVATIVALALVLCISLGYHLFRSLGLGILLAWLVVCGGNFKPVAQLYQNYLLAGHFVPEIDFWDASRAMTWGPFGLIQLTEINEIPSFSFILGDLHPHFSAHPVFLGFLLMVVALWRAAQRRTFSAYEVLKGRLAQWTALALLAGLLYATNTWDCYVGLFMAAVALPFARGFRDWPAGGRIVFGALVLVLVYVVAKRLLFLPFDVMFVPPRSFHLAVLSWWPPKLDISSPVAIVPVELRSTVTQWLFYFGLFALPYFAWQLWGMTARSGTVPLDRKTAHLSIALAVSLLAYIHGQNKLIGLLAFVLVALAPSAFRRRRHERLELVSIFTWLAVLLSFLCEWFYYNDAFSGRDERINTIFKVYYCLWPVTALGAVAACSALWGGRGTSFQMARRAAALLLVLFLFAIGSLYPLFGWTTRVANYRKYEIGLGSQPTLDGLNYLERLPGLADDYLGALWLRRHTSPYSVIAETYEWGYSAAGRFATISGDTCLLGWSQHETVWREGFDWQLVEARKKTIDDLFTTTSLEGAIGIIRNHAVDYVAVGWLERLRYSREELAKFDLIGKEVFRTGETAIYSFVPEARAETPTAGGAR
jgi:YYY domain-containing protein